MALDHQSAVASRSDGYVSGAVRNRTRKGERLPLVGGDSAALRRAERHATAEVGSPRIGILYPSGWGNLGDEAILQATFQALRDRWPRVDLRAFTLHPAKTASNHNVEAEPLTGVSRPLFCAPRTEEPLVVRAAQSVARRTRRVPVVWRLSRWVSSCIADLVFEARSVARARRWLETADLVLASGGGQLDDVWGGAWGQPYALARWAWQAKRAGVPFAFLSVGFGGASSWLSRRFLRYAVENSTYCSVRDQGSRALTKGIGVRKDIGVVPDLAFSLDCDQSTTSERPGFDIGVSPMTYLRPGSWPGADRLEYERLVGLWADIVSSIVSEGNRAKLFVSAPEDMVAVNDVWDRLSEETRAGTSIHQAANPDSLLDFYRGVDVVISSRLHGVVLAMVAGRPVVALSHERKVRTVMQDAGASASCAELATATVAETMLMIRAVLDDLDSCSETLRGYVRGANTAVSEQHDMLPQLIRRAR